MRLPLKHAVVRSWEAEDAESIAIHANNRKVWLNLRDAFPHPYTPADGKAFIQASLEADPETSFCIAVEGKAVGAMGFCLKKDVERLSAEIGYWLGETFWGRGITTEALRAVTAHALETHGLARIYAVPFAWNPASCRVLEKSGYLLEGRMQSSAIKDGKVVDQLLYAYVVPR